MKATFRKLENHKFKKFEIYHEQNIVIFEDQARKFYFNIKDKDVLQRVATVIILQIKSGKDQNSCLFNTVKVKL